MVTPVNPSFTRQKWGVSGYSLHGLVFVMHGYPLDIEADQSLGWVRMSFCCILCHMYINTVTAHSINNPIYNISRDQLRSTYLGRRRRHSRYFRHLILFLSLCRHHHQPENKPSITITLYTRTSRLHYFSMRRGSKGYPPPLPKSTL